MSVMLYKHPGKHEIHGDKFDYIIVDESEVDQAVKDGWFYTTDEAKTPEKEPEQKPKPKAGRPKKVVENVVDKA